MGKRKLTAEQETTILSMYRGGTGGATTIGKILGLHCATVNNVRRRHGIPVMYRPGAPKGNRNRTKRT